MANKLATVIAKANALPTFMRSWALSSTFNSVVKFAGTARVRIDEADFLRVAMHIDNQYGRVL